MAGYAFIVAQFGEDAVREDEAALEVLALLVFVVELPG